jgi:hypothetical protein
MMSSRCDLPETEIHHILSNPRRRKTLRYLSDNHGTISVRELSEEIAAAETGESPPPRDVRKAVYVSLHQTHLPLLDDKGVIDYDRSSKEVTLLDPARDIHLYMEVVTKYGITWAEFYRNLGVISLVTVTAAIVEIPAISMLDPLLWASLFLVLFAGSTVFHLWTRRWMLFRQFLS